MKKYDDVDSYIADADEAARPMLEELRKLITSTIPEAEETIWYGVPFFRYHGELAGIDAFKHHVSFGMGAEVFDSTFRETLHEQGYKTGKATVQIKFDQEIPTAVIQDLLRAKARLNETKEP